MYNATREFGLSRLHSPYSVCVCVSVFSTLTDRVATSPSKILGCQSGSWSAGQEGTSTTLQREHMTTKTNKTKTIKREEGHLIERVWSTASHEPSDTPSDRYYLAFASKGISSTTPWVGPINAALKRLKLTTVTPGATLTLSASSASLFLCRFSDAFSTALPGVYESNESNHGVLPSIATHCTYISSTTCEPPKHGLFPQGSQSKSRVRTACRCLLCCGSPTVKIRGGYGTQ